MKYNIGSIEPLYKLAVETCICAVSKLEVSEIERIGNGPREVLCKTMLYSEATKIVRVFYRNRIKEPVERG